MSRESVLDFFRAHGMSLTVAALLLAGLTWKLRDPWADTVRVDSVPVQGETIENPRSWPHEGAVLTEVATWELDAVILSEESYRMDHFASVIPIDLALGWGIMSDPEVLEHIKIAQRNRWFWLRWKSDMPYSETDVFLASSNVHILPANDAVRRQLRRIDQGDNVHLLGRLVDVSLDGAEMRSSRSREDRGGGACEVFYLEYIDRR